MSPWGCLPRERGSLPYEGVRVFLTKTSLDRSPLDRDPLDRDPLRQIPLQTETPSDRDPPLGRDNPGQRPLDRDRTGRRPYHQTDACEKLNLRRLRLRAVIIQLQHPLLSTRKLSKEGQLRKMVNYNTQNNDQWEVTSTLQQCSTGIINLPDMLRHLAQSVVLYDFLKVVTLTVQLNLVT